MGLPTATSTQVGRMRGDTGGVQPVTPGTTRSRRGSNVDFGFGGTVTMQVNAGSAGSGNRQIVEQIPRSMPRTTYSPKIDELKALVKSILFPQPRGNIVERSPGMTVRKIIQPGSDGVAMPMCCVSFDLPQFPAHEVYNFLRDKLGSINWHKDVAKVTEMTERLGTQAVLDNDVGNGPPGFAGASLRLFRTEYKIPSFAKWWGFPPREVLEYRCCIATEREAYFIVGTSSGTEALGIPEAPGHKRAHLNCGAYAFVPLPQGGCELRTVAHLNPTGVPSWILDMIATKKPKEFVESCVEQLNKGTR